MAYVIEIDRSKGNQGWTGNAEDGYRFRDYFRAPMPEDFGSRQEAEAFIAANFRGPDAEGVAPILTVAEA